MSFSYGIGVKEKWQAKDVSNYKALNKVTTKYQYLLPFCEFFLRSSKTQNVHIQRWVQRLTPSGNCPGGSIEDHIHHTVGNILLHSNAFWFV